MLASRVQVNNPIHLNTILFPARVLNILRQNSLRAASNEFPNLIESNVTYQTRRVDNLTEIKHFTRFYTNIHPVNEATKMPEEK